MIHSGSGKTALTESLLYMTGAIDRMGKCADGNTVCDYDPEEIKRQNSITTSVAPLEYKGCFVQNSSWLIQLLVSNICDTYARRSISGMWYNPVGYYNVIRPFWQLFFWRDCPFHPG